MKKLIKKIGVITKKVLLLALFLDFFGWSVLGAFSVGKAQADTVTVTNTARVEVPVDPEYPILAKIAKCESGGTQFDKNGQVVLKANTNGSVDIGYMQVNQRIWGKKAHEMGYDLTKENDNKTFGVWLFKNYGSEPWFLTKSCWSK